ncbi:TPM domain-containing protein [Polaromonas sp.]|uniref:TPM domain-containing protein n=1 Tax=Polaromonas sp. TaxID=1869339 RepID=UPI001800CCE6|nr:TPM domain-containing protein [Polaromonas sp.]NML86646.1 TPM domain-containing protein [Polaromonas sp.]
MMNKLALLLKHLWLDSSDSRRAIPPDMVKRLAERVAASEQRHSGQIRICVEASLPASYLWRLDRKNTIKTLIRQRAITMFGKLGVWDTEHNNGVLIYVLLAEHALEIVADRGLTRHVDAAQWQAMLAGMAGAFQEKRYEDGLTQAVQESSAVLMANFARTNLSLNHPNELPDTPLLQ